MCKKYKPTSTIDVKLLDDHSDYIEVTCGVLQAKLHRQRFVCPGVNRDCIEYDGKLMTPTAFSILAGKGSSRDWKRAIMIDGEKIRRYIDSGMLYFYNHKDLCTGRCRSKFGNKISLLPMDRQLPTPSGLSTISTSSTLNTSLNTDSVFNSSNKIGRMSITKRSPDPVKKSDSKKAMKASRITKKRKKRQKNLICDTCNNTFETLNNLRRHVVTHMYHRQRYTCKHCPKEFVSIEGRDSHELSHIGERHVECDECGKCFYTLKILKNHKFCVHKNRMPALCYVCGKSFKSNQNLKRHASVHSEEKTFECKHCSKRFRTFELLNNHLKTHRKFACDICSETFEGKRELRRHKMTHNKKAYQCDQCEASFDQNCNLTKHKVIHLGLKPYKCHMCDSSHAHRSNLNKHLKTSHNLTPKSEGWIGIRRAKKDLDNV